MHRHDTPTDGVLFGWNTDTNSLALHEYHHLIGGLEVPKGSHLRGRTVRCAHAVRALCEKLAVLHHREFGKFRRLKGRH